MHKERSTDEANCIGYVKIKFDPATEETEYSSLPHITPT